MCSFVVQIEMKEVDRLAAVVARIQEEAAAVPKGAYMQTEAGKVVPNNSFHGLSLRRPHTSVTTCTSLQRIYLPAHLAMYVHYHSYM